MIQGDSATKAKSRDSTIHSSWIGLNSTAEDQNKTTSFRESSSPPSIVANSRWRPATATATAPPPPPRRSRRRSTTRSGCTRTSWSRRRTGGASASRPRSAFESSQFQRSRNINDRLYRMTSILGYNVWLTSYREFSSAKLWVI